MRLIKPLIILLFCYNINAQTSPIDSLFNVIDHTNEIESKIKYCEEILSIHASSISNIERSYNHCINIAITEKNDSMIMNIQKQAMSRLFLLGYNKKGNQYFKKLIKLAKDKKMPQFIAEGHLSSARIIHNSGKIDEANSILMKGEKAIENYDLPIQKSDLILERSFYEREKGNLDNALALNAHAIRLIKTTSNTSKYSNALSSRGLTHRRLGNIDSASYYYKKAEEELGEDGNQINFSVIYNNLGNIEHIRGNYDDAITYYMKSIKIKEKLKNERGLSIGYHNVGAINIDMKDWDSALTNFELSNEIGGRINFQMVLVHNYLKIAVAYKGKENDKKALDSNLKALEIAKSIKMASGEIKALLGSGLDYLRLGDINKSYLMLEEATELASVSKNKSDKTDALIAMAEWYLVSEEAGLDSSNKITDTQIENMLLEAYVLGNEMGYSEKTTSVYKGLEKLYNKNGNYEKLSNILTEHMAHNDSLFTKNSSDVVSEWRTKLDLAQKEKDIISLETQNELANYRTRIWQSAFIFGILLFGILTLIYQKYKKNENEKIRLKENESLRTKVSSDLHDEVGTMLSSIAMQMDVLSLSIPEEGSKKLEKLSHMSRSAMDKMRDTVWAIDSRKDDVYSLIDRMGDFLADIEESNKLSVNFKSTVEDMQAHLQPDVRQNIYLIFKEAVTNAFKYSNGDKMQVRLEHNSNNIMMTVIDNGTLNSNKIKTSGTGMSNMLLRAKLIGAKLEISHGQNFEVKLAI